MPRPIWKGHISFGLVSVPVQLFSAEKRYDLHFNLVDSRNNARVRYERVNEATGEEVPWSEIVKAYEYEDGNYIVLEEEDFKRAAVEQTNTVEIEDFVDREDIDDMYFDKPYYLVPGPKGEKGYVLLRETLKRAKKTGIARVVIRTRQYLAALLARDDALVLILLRFHQELRAASEFDLPRGSLKDYRINPRELDMAERLVETMTTEWKPQQYKDEYRDALMNWIEKKAKAGGKTPVIEGEEEEEEKPAGEIIDFMELLKKSVQGGKAAKPAKKPPAKRKPAPKAKARTKSAAGRRKASGS